MKTPMVVLMFSGLLAGFEVSCSTPAKKETEETIEKVAPETATTPMKNDLPGLQLTALDGTRFDAKSLLGKKLVLILFQPTCEHCQNEAHQISERLSAFKNYSVYFISSAALPDIDKFSKDFKLIGQPNVHFAGTSVQSIIDSYGPIPAPSIYIYSDKGTLLNNFNGEVEIDVVIKYL